jgi:hypothetical protein
MWIFTKHGFFSAVCARKGTGKHGQPIDPDRLMIRARVGEHLKALKERFPSLLGESEIQESHNTDYAYRIFCEKRTWSEVLSGLAKETDYDNFKSAVAGHRGPGDAYERSLHDVWALMYKLQRPSGR